MKFYGKFWPEMYNEIGSKNGNADTLCKHFYRSTISGWNHVHAINGFRIIVAEE